MLPDRCFWTFACRGICPGASTCWPGRKCTLLRHCHGGSTSCRGVGRSSFYCICGFQVSGKAVTELRQRGYDARALAGGITAWHAIGGATVAMDLSTYEEAAIDSE